MSDHDCVESWPQKVVLRPRPSPGGYITGTLQSFGTIDAEIQVTDFSWDGEVICEPGLYTLPVAG